MTGTQNAGLADRPSPGAPLIVLMGISLGPLVVLGIGRLAYSLMVPTMRQELGWSYEAAGWVATAVTAGYLGGTLLCPLAARLAGIRTAFALGTTLPNRETATSLP